MLPHPGREQTLTVNKDGRETLHIIDTTADGWIKVASDTWRRYGEGINEVISVT